VGRSEYQLNNNGRRGGINLKGKEKHTTNNDSQHSRTYIPLKNIKYCDASKQILCLLRKGNSPRQNLSGDKGERKTGGKKGTRRITRPPFINLSPSPPKRKISNTNPITTTPKRRSKKGEDTKQNETLGGPVCMLVGG